MALAMDSFADTLLRQRVVAQINAAREGLELEEGANSSEEMEHVLFSNAKDREEYMQLIATLVLHFNEKKKQALKDRISEKAQSAQSPSKEEPANGAAASTEDKPSEETTENTEETTKEGATKS